MVDITTSVRNCSFRGAMFYLHRHQVSRDNVIISDRCTTGSLVFLARQMTQISPTEVCHLDVVVGLMHR